MYIKLNSNAENYVDVMNMNGQLLIKKMRLTKSAEQIDISEFSQGMYFIHVYGNNINGIKNSSRIKI